MPYVNVRIAKEDGVTAEKKRTLIQKITQLLADELGKNPASTTVVIDELDPDNWGFGGETVTNIRARNKK